LMKTESQTYAFLLTQKILADKAQIRINSSHFEETIPLAAVVPLPLAPIDYTLTYLYAINPVTRLILEGTSFLRTYLISLGLFKVGETGDFEHLKKAIPHQLEKILNLIGSFIAHRKTL